MLSSDFSANDLILVDGASSGIGRATVLALNALGARVVGIARRADRLAEVKSMCRFGDNFFYETCDLSENIEELPDFIKELCRRYGAFSGYVHAAGVLNPQPLGVFDSADAHKDFNTNLFSALMIIKSLARKKNRQELLSIVFVSSVAAKIGHPGALAYGMTKAAINSAVSSLSQEIGGQRIRINSVMPSGIKTEMADSFVADDYLDKVREKNIFHEDGKPEYVADLITFLLAPKSYWIQGQNIVIDGGETLA